MPRRLHAHDFDLKTLSLKGIGEVDTCASSKFLTQDPIELLVRGESELNGARGCDTPSTRRNGDGGLHHRPPVRA